MQNAAQPQDATSTATAPASLCANRTLCYEANDFVATVTEFRVSTDPRGYKIIDAMMHFQNKTNQPISLGYVDGSGSAIDDMGNRLILNTYNGGVRGMGVVAGNNMDPKFTLGAGGGGDARFELYWAPGNRLSGVNYEMEVSIREMNRVEGNQWTLGDEALIHYQGLANGTGVAPVSNGNSAGMGSGSARGPVMVNNAVSSFVPGQSSGSGTQTMGAAQPCPPGSSTRGTLVNTANSAGAQNQQANDAVSNATATISNLGSLFGHKKKAATAPAASTTNTAAPCTPVVNTSAVAPAAAPATVPATTATNATTAGPQANVRPAAVVAKPTAGRPVAGVTNTALRQPVPSTQKASAPAKKPAATTPPANPNAPATK